MAADIGVKLKLDGERDFRAAVKDCNAELKNMQSALKLASTEAEGQAKSLDTLKNKEKALNDTIDASVKKEKTLSDIVDKVKKKRDDAKKALDDAKKAEGDNAAAVEKAQKAYQNAENAVNRWETELNKAKTTTAKLENELSNTKGEIDKFGKETDEAAESEEEFAKKGEKAGSAVDAMATAMISSGIVGALKDVADGLLDCIKSADEFEVAMKKVSTIADTSAVSVEDLEQAIMEQSSALAVNASDYAEATYQAMSASVDTANAVDFVANATKLAEAGFTDATTATDVLTTAINAYGLTAEDAANISDILVTTQNLGKTSVDQLAQSMGNVLPIASTYNVSLEDLATSYVELTRNGINTASATTDLRAMIGELGDSSKDVAQILLEKTGKSFSELMGEGKSLGDVMDILADSVDGDKNKFAELWASARTSGVAALTLLNRGTKDYNGVLKQMKSSTGAVDTAFKKMTGTSEYTSRRLKNSVNNLKIAVGKELSPALTKLQGAFADMVEGATNFVKEHPEVVKAFTAIAVALGVITGAVVAYQAAVKIADIITKAFTATNPWMLLATAIAGVVAALAVLTDGFKQQETPLTRMKDAINEANDAQNNLNDALATSKSDFEKTATGIETQAKNATYLKDELFDLVNAEEQTAEDQERIAVLVERLNGLYPELGLEYDKQTNSLNLTNEELSKYIENTRKAARLEAYKTRIAAETEAIVEAEQKLVDAEKDYQKAAGENAAFSEKIAALNRKRLDAQEKLTKAQEKYEKVMADVYSSEQDRIDAENELRTATDENTAALNEWNQECETNRDILDGIDSKTEEYKNTVKEANDTIANANENIDRMIGESNELENQLDESALALENHQAAVEANTGAMQTSTDSMWLSQNAAERMSAAYVNADEVIRGSADAVLAKTTEMADAIRNAVDTSVQSFRDFNDNGTWEVQDFTNSIQEQINKITTWESNLAELIKFGVSEDVVQGFAAMGLASDEMVAGTVAQLQSLQQTAPEQVEGLVGELNTAYAKLWELENGENGEAKSLETAIAEQAAGGQEALKQLGIDLQQPAYDAMGYLNDGFLEGISAGQEALNKALEEAGEDGIDAMNEGWGTHSPSWKTEESGRSVDSGFVKGLTGGKAALLSVARGVANATIEAMRINPMTAQGIGLSFSTGLANGILSGRSRIINAAVEAAQAAITATKNTLDIHSPSKVMEGLGENTGEGFALGLAKETALIGAEMRSMISVPDFSLPELSRYDTYEAPTVNVYVGNRQLTAAMADAVTHEISSAQQAGYRGARTA